METKTIFSVGAKPTVNTDPTAWAQQSFTDPLPISYTLEPMDALILRVIGNEKDIRIATM